MCETLMNNDHAVCVPLCVPLCVCVYRYALIRGLQQQLAALKSEQHEQQQSAEIATGSALASQQIKEEVEQLRAYVAQLQQEKEYVHANRCRMCLCFCLWLGDG